ncbi:MAG: hypothetical protein H7Y00_07075 [Fimbriimonadaceae bacterium]|nr:hypothetical protein [Chitinophagales bacterium]
MKKIFFFTYILLSFISAYTQVKTFSPDQETFMKEMGNFMSANNNEEGKIAFNAFEDEVEKGNLTQEQIEQLISISNDMLGKKLRPSPAFAHLLNAVTAFLASGQLEDTYNNWMQVNNELLQNGKNPVFIKWLEFSGPFFGKSALYDSESKTWYYNAFDYKMKVVDEIPQIQFPTANLSGTTTNDRFSISETSGTYYPTEEEWKGKKGIVNWMRAGLDSNNVYATLPPSYRIIISKNDYKIDSVTFYYIGQLQKPLLGTFNDKLLLNFNPEKIEYPQFKSYDASIKIKDIIDRVDYYGSFFIKGPNIAGAGQDSALARLDFRDINDRVLMSARSKSFLIKPDAIFSQHAEIILHINKDSIYHPDANLNFDAVHRTATITRGEIGASGSAFYSSYHKMDADVDQIAWPVDDTILVMRNVIGAGQKRSYFESENLFSNELYTSIQGVSPANPIVLFKRYSEKTGTKEIPASVLAKEINSTLTVDGIRTLLYEMMKEGFLYFDAETQMVTLKDKIFNYTNAYTGKRDYDIIQIMSQTAKPNAIFDLNKKSLRLDGVSQVFLSDSQFVLFYPDSAALEIRKNRDMFFSGRVVGGNADFIGKSFYFSYDTFDIKMTNVDSMILYVESTEVDEFGNPLYLPVKTSFSVLQGKMQIDKADNKSSKKKCPQYPLFISYSSSKADYEKAEVFDSVYQKDEFYFKVDPFTIEKLDEADYTVIKFGGTMISDGIFPDFKEQLSLQKDRSLGFKTKTPAEGFKMYESRGIFKDSIYLSNQGFRGSGNITFMASNSSGKNFIFFPDSTIGKVDQFAVTKTEKGVQFPSVQNTYVNMNWRPYDDDMRITQGETPFKFFDGYTVFKGYLDITSNGLESTGTMEWLDVALSSEKFTYESEKMKSDNADMKIQSVDPDKLALKLNDVKADVDFNKKIGNFKSNNDTVMTEMPYNMYTTTINEFNWDMEAKILDFKSTNKKYGTFYSTNKTQDGLSFEGTNGKFDMKNYVLGIEGVPHIVVGDSHLKPDSGKVFVEAEAKMRTLKNATIIGDTLFTYHIIKGATIDVYGKNAIKGTGFYDYVNPKVGAQKIPLEEIGIKKTIDSLTDYENFQVYAKGYVSDSAKFVLEKNVHFKGAVELNTPDQFLKFRGYTKLIIADTSDEFTAWFRIDDFIDPANPVFSLEYAKNESNNDSLFAGIFRNTDSIDLYMRIMGKRRQKNDPMIFGARGQGYYDEQTDKFYFGNLDKLFDASQPGGIMTYNNKSGEIICEGPILLGLKTEISEVKSYGTIQKTLKDSVFKIDAAVAIAVPLPEDLLKSIGEMLSAGNSESAPIDYSAEQTLISALNTIATDAKEAEKLNKSLNDIGYLEKPKDSKFTIFTNNINMFWDSKTKSFISSSSAGQLIWFGSQQFNQDIKCYVQFGKKTSGDYYTIYFETPYEDWLYITYRIGQMKILTSNDDLNATILNMDASKRTIKNENGRDLVFMIESKPQVGKFVRKIQAYTGESADDSPIEDDDEDE